MFGLGAWEIIVILTLALIVLGPQKLPELAKQLAKLMGDLRRVADDVRDNFEEAAREPQKTFAELVAAAQQDRTKPVSTAVGVATDVPADTPPSPEAAAAPLQATPVAGPTAVADAQRSGADSKADAPRGELPHDAARSAQEDNVGAGPVSETVPSPRRPTPPDSSNG